VVSHPAVLSVNQVPYGELASRGWDVSIVVPDRWRHEYSDADVEPQALPGLERSLRPTRVLLRGKPQRHVYLARCRAIMRETRPDVAFLEAEPFSLPAAQWGYVCNRLGIPFGVQSYENIDRPFPAPVRWMRGRVLASAAFVAARSDAALRLVREWGARGEVELVPPAVPPWPQAAGGRPSPERPFTVGFAGRLVASKGLDDLLAAVRRLDGPVELLLIGDGAMRSQLEGQAIPGSQVRVLAGIRHEQMADAYARLDVLVLPSRTTPTWKEQFGRVVIESLWCGVPVIGSDSGEIPWLIGLTGGGLVFPEGDRETLTERLQELRSDPARRRALAAAGRSSVERLFSVPAATDALEQMLERAAGRREVD
jgi:glycosyltransferase involved in cell wall biosynthesis